MEDQDFLVHLKEFSRFKKKISKRIKRVRRPWLTLEPISVGVESGGAQLVAELTGSQLGSYPIPRFIGRQPYNSPEQLPVMQWASVTLTEHHQVKVFGNSNFLVKNGKAVHPDLYIPHRDRAPFELYGGAIMNNKFTQVRLPIGLSLGTINRAITICDQTPFNYAHWMTEVLPKLALISELPQCENVPILVDAGIGVNQIEAVRAVLGQRELIKIPPYENVIVNELLSISPTSYCPHEFRDFHGAQESGFQFFFSGEALTRLRDILRHTYKKYDNGRVRKIYIKRTPLWTWNNRNIENIDEIEDLIDDYGIETVNVTGMTFAQQAKIFMNADAIIAPTGAALANMIFAKPGCKIVVLSALYDGATYDYFHQMAHLLEHDLSFVVGPQVGASKHHMNRDYVIHAAHLKQTLEMTLQPEAVQMRSSSRR